MRTDFNMFAGDTKVLQVSVKNSLGAVVNLTGATVQWAVSRDVNTTPVVSKSTPVDISIISSTGGLFQVVVKPEDTEQLDGVYYHEAQVTEADGTISTVFYGYVTITKTLIS